MTSARNADDPEERAQRREDYLKERWRASAEAYASAAFELDTYRLSNAQLVAAAGLEPGVRVLDLACGGGATLAAAFAHEPALGPCWAVDWVEEMVQAARKNLEGHAIRFLVAPAQDFARHVGSSCVERVLCNSAFFQFHEPRQVLREIHSVLSPGGRLGLTLPGASNTAECMLALQRAGLVTPPNAALGPPTGDERCGAHNAEALLSGAGFTRVVGQALRMRTSARDYARWFSLPVFRRPEWQARSQADLEAALEEALRAAKLEPELTWIVLTATRP